MREHERRERKKKRKGKAQIGGMHSRVYNDTVQPSIGARRWERGNV